MNKRELIDGILNKPITAERGCVGFNVNVDVILEELTRKAVNTPEEKELAEILHAASLINRNPDSYDEKIQNTLKLINSSGNGITTQYSCSSHPRYYFDLPMSWLKEEENKPFNVLNVSKDSATGEYMLSYPNEFYIRSIVPKGLLHSITQRVVDSGLLNTTKNPTELFGKPYTIFVDELNERAGQHGGNSLFGFMYISDEVLDYIDGLDMRVSPFDENNYIVSFASNLINVVFALEDAQSVYWELINRLEIKILKALGVIENA